jgi:hypothetical protein
MWYQIDIGQREENKVSAEYFLQNFDVPLASFFNIFKSVAYAEGFVNSSSSRDMMQHLISSRIKKMVNHGLLNDGAVVVNSTNNLPLTEDTGNIVVKIYIIYNDDHIMLDMAKFEP